MKDEDKTKTQLIDELAKMRVRIAELETMETEHKKMEEELQKASKLKSVGIMADGIAHDFNNILTAVLGNISLAKTKTNPEDKIFKILEEAEKASLRARNLIHQLLAFAKEGTPVRRITSITELIKDATLFALSGSNIQCEFSISNDLWPVEVDVGQMSQVINNVVMNARQAMPGGGIITVHAENVAAGTEQTLPLKDVKHIKILIKDQGGGISQEQLSGSGLGLSTVYSIIKNHDGYVTQKSESGAGTTLCIYIPAAQEETPFEKQIEEKTQVGKNRILVMDDEEPVRDVIGAILKHIGYEVAFAKDGVEAIEVYKKAKESGKHFDTVIMDLTIPGGMGGEEAIKKLLEIDPQVKAIVSSGYSNDPIISDFRKYGFRGFITKPYDIGELSETVDKVISE